MKQLEAAAEAILFASGDSVETEKLAKALGIDPDTTKELLHRMMERYKKEQHGIYIVELEDAFQMCTKPEMFEYLVRIEKQPKKTVLTDVIMETLSIIAYKQPITKLELEQIRGVKCDHAINKLIEYNLVKEVGRLDAPGRPILFGTTEEFLRCFGVSSLAELPPIDRMKIEDFKAEAEAEINLTLKV